MLELLTRRDLGSEIQQPWAAALTAAPEDSPPGWSSIPALGWVIWDQEHHVQGAVQVLFLISSAPLT